MTNLDTLALVESVESVCTDGAVVVAATSIGAVHPESTMVHKRHLSTVDNIAAAAEQTAAGSESDQLKLWR